MKENIVQMLRRITCVLLLLVASVFITSYTYMTDDYTNDYSYRRIGYTTSYSNGQFNSSQYNSMFPESYNYNQRYIGFGNERVYSGTYNPYSQGSYGRNSNGGSRGQPRRISVYNGEGEEEETPGGNSDNPDWLYQYDETTGTWWCSKDGGLTWWKWDSWLGLGWFAWKWREGRGDPTDNAEHYHNDPNNSWVVPIGDGVGIMLFLATMMAVYIAIKDKRRMSQQNSW